MTVTTTFDTAKVNKPTITTFSGSNLTVENTAANSTVAPTSAAIQCPTTHGLPSGVKAYFEVTCVANPGSHGLALIAWPAHSLTTNPEGAGANSAVWYRGGLLQTNGSTLSVDTWTAGDLLCFYVRTDLSPAQLWVRKGAAGLWNASGTADPVSNVGGLGISSAVVAGNILCASPAFFNSGCKDTWNFGATAFTGAIPSGGSAWNDVAIAREAPVGVSTESDSSLGLAGKQILGVGLAAESDAALTLPPGGALVGISTETSTALALAGRQIAAAGVAAGSNTALQLTPAQIRTAGLSAASETALQLTGRQTRTAGLGPESDAALALSPGGGTLAGLSIETSTALARTGKQAGSPGVANDNESALALLGRLVGTYGLALEADQAFGISSPPVGSPRTGRIAQVPARGRSAASPGRNERTGVVPARRRVG